jgi:hypothetical protein
VERKGFHHRNHTHTTDERGALFLAIGETRLRNWVGKRGNTSRPSVIIVQELVNEQGRRRVHWVVHRALSLPLLTLSRRLAEPGLHRLLEEKWTRLTRSGTSGSDPQPPKKAQNLGGNLPLGSQIS